MQSPEAYWMLNISIHSPHTRGDQYKSTDTKRQYRFQSTPLTRGETVYALGNLRHAEHFNPLPSHEGRLTRRDAERLARAISIHSPHTRGDADGLQEREGDGISIHSPHTRGDLRRGERWRLRCGISIHSPHTRGDLFRQPPVQTWQNFNPLPSHEGRL